MAENYKGKFIVIYGPNNIGKTTQLNLLESYFDKMFGYSIERIKYPIYDLEPTGPLLNKVLRHKDQLDKEYTELQIQKIFVQNRRDFQPTLVEKLKLGTTVLAEDYVGTGIAWGATHGVDIEAMIELNEGLLEPNLSILLDGDRFKDASVEVGHKNEDDTDEVWNLNRKIHQEIAKRFGWKIVNANLSIEEVHKQIMSIVSSSLGF